MTCSPRSPVLLDARAEGFVELSLDDGPALVFDAAKVRVRAREAQLLAAYGINAARSASLR